MQPNNENEQLEWYSAILGDPLYTGIAGGIAGTILAGLVVGLIMARRSKNKGNELRAAFASQSAEEGKERAQLTHKLEVAEHNTENMEDHLRRHNEHIDQLTDTLESTFSLQERVTEAGQQQTETEDLFADALLHKQDEVVTQIKERWLNAMRERTDHESRLHSLSDNMAKQQTAIDELIKTAATQQMNIAELEKDLVAARKTTIEKTVERAQRLPHEVRERIDERLVNPVLGHIHDTTEKVQQLPRQVKRNLDDRVLNPVKKQVNGLRQQVNDLSAMVQELPHQAKVNLDERLVNPARAQVYQVSNRIRRAPNDLKERVIHPVQDQFHHATESVQKLPHRAKVRFDEVAVRPVTAQFERMREIVRLQSEHAIDLFNNRLVHPAMANLESLSAITRSLPSQSKTILKEKIIEPTVRQLDSVRQTLQRKTGPADKTTESGPAETARNPKQQMSDFMSLKTARTTDN